MMYFADAMLEKLAAHRIGNKHEGGELIISDKIIEPDEDLQEILKTYFFQVLKILFIISSLQKKVLRTIPYSSLLLPFSVPPKNFLVNQKK